MMKQILLELEKLIFKVVKKEGMAAGIMADIIGVLIDLKPAMTNGFNEESFKNLNVDEFIELLDKLGLKVVFFGRCHLGYKKMVSSVGFYISKKISLAKQTHESFIELWATMDDRGQILDKKKWKFYTKKIGNLLGYPKTAINDFIKEQDLNNNERIARMDRNRYYAHSAKYEEKEYKKYDLVLNKAISEYAPKTTKYMTADKKRRWI